jgi:NADPH-dependent curcumin reductase CurA
MPRADDFALAEVDVRAPEDGEVLVRNLYMSVDPYMRGRMNEARSYAPPYEVGKAMYGGAVGEVVESKAPALSNGDLVLSNAGWREAFVSPAERLQKLPADAGAPASSYLGVLGMPGFTAWYGLKHLGQPKAGETVFVSAAAGAVGSVAGQLARAWGCRAVGSAGSDEKVRYATHELGFDAALNYRSGSVAESLHKAAPEGIDVYFDNVGGDHLEAALGALHDFGRIVACGAISRYNDARPVPGPSNLSLVVSKRLRMQGFIISDHYDLQADFLAEVGPLVRAGKLRWRETVVEGIERAPEAFLRLFSGDKLGKMLVKLTPG